MPFPCFLTVCYIPHNPAHPASFSPSWPSPYTLDSAVSGLLWFRAPVSFLICSRLLPFRITASFFLLLCLLVLFCVLLLMIMLPASCLSSGPFCCPPFVGWRIPVARFLHLLPHLNFAPPVFFPAVLPAPCSPYAYFLAFFQHELTAWSPTPVLSGSLFHRC